uniref:Taste receptor, type 1, member 1 n=1 Tax=Neogobius melanostomus TaxID=47308 RepID=A0A8C6SNS9_9GOBI
MTNKVWIGTEDWTVATQISGIPGVHTIGTVLGVALKSADVHGFAQFEKTDYEKSIQYNGSKESGSSGGDCLQSTSLYSVAKNYYALETYDLISSFNVYKAVYAVAHALHQLLDCNSGMCSNRTVQPWEVPLSICSPPCPTGHKKILTGQHVCCFDCEACPAAMFFNRSDPTECQPCPAEEWSPEKSEHCLARTVLLLTWDDPLTIALLFFMACCLVMTVSSGIILLLHITSPVAKSAGGRTCLVMLAALTLAALSSLCHFGQPSQLACLIKHPLFIFSFTVCLAAITVRSFQVVCIFKFASKLPPIYDRWAKKNGPEWTIFVVSFTVLIISILRVVVDPPKPSKDFEFFHDSIVIECSNTLSIGSVVEVAYVTMLSMLCFFFSYLGKDLPANYNEAKCVTFSLMVYMISWISFFTLYLISRGPFTMAAHVFAILFSVLAFYGGYFLPKIYIIVLKPELNTTAHFQNCIQMYTMSK